MENISRCSNWIDYYLGLAKVISKKSHDIHTQHGCVITDRKNRVLGIGYNDFPRGLDDSKLPTNRPYKYSWMIHAERNALANCVIRPDDGIAYVTGQCCNDCIMSLWQEGISEVYMIQSHGSHLFDHNEQKIFNQFIELSKLKIHYVLPNLEWMKGVLDSYPLKENNI